INHLSIHFHKNILSVTISSHNANRHIFFTEYNYDLLNAMFLNRHTNVNMLKIESKQLDDEDYITIYSQCHIFGTHFFWARENLIKGGHNVDNVELYALSLYCASSTFIILYHIELFLACSGIHDGVFSVLVVFETFDMIFFRQLLVQDFLHNMEEAKIIILKYCASKLLLREPTHGNAQILSHARDDIVDSWSV
ncbi:hypothetical protein ACJX0J_037049, partial [Zea mays]